MAQSSRDQTDGDCAKFKCHLYKASTNWRRHRITFHEAVEAFFDPRAIEAYDDEHSNDENRFRIIGMSRRRLLLVIYSEPTEGIVRIISVRKAEKKYQIAYEQGYRSDRR